MQSASPAIIDNRRKSFSVFIVYVILRCKILVLLLVPRRFRRSYYEQHTYNQSAQNDSSSGNKRITPAEHCSHQMSDYR